MRGPWLGLAWLASRAFLEQDGRAIFSLTTLGSWALAGMQKWWERFECHWEPGVPSRPRAPWPGSHQAAPVQYE